MKTVVETYIIEETQELIYDNEKLDKWNQHVAELGLTGQTKIQSPTKSPIPFLHMKAPLVRVFSTLCPRVVDVTEYDKTPIPVEVLDLIALSKKENYFNKISIWYDDETADPACVGHKGFFFCYDSSYNRSGEFQTESEAEEFKIKNGLHTVRFNEEATYLIARWADVKMSLDQLTEKAKRVYVASQKDEQNKRIMEAKRKLEDLEIEANQHFGYTTEPIDDLGF